MLSCWNDEVLYTEFPKSLKRKVLRGMVEVTWLFAGLVIYYSQFTWFGIGRCRIRTAWGGWYFRETATGQGERNWYFSNADIWPDV